MNAMLINLFLAVVWASLMDQITLDGLVVGYVASYLLLWWLRPLLGPTKYFEKVPRTISFLLFFLKEFLWSNVRVAIEVLSPRRNGRTGIVAVPLSVRSDFEISLLMALITLTPGTMGIDISSDRKILFLHAMFVTTADDVRESIKEGFERRVLELFR